MSDWQKRQQLEMQEIYKRRAVEMQRIAQNENSMLADISLRTRWLGGTGWGNLAMGISDKGDNNSKLLADAMVRLTEMTEVLERIKKEALILYQIDKISADKKHCFIKKGETELRISAVEDLVRGDEVLLHPKTMQIVERLGKPPLVASRFAQEMVGINVHWDDIGGLDDAKAALQEAIEIPVKHADLMRMFAIRGIKGILLAGPPGCGKTMLGKACATSLATLHGSKGSNSGFLYVKGPEILDKYVGNSEQTIRDLFWDARRHKEEYGYPAIIFLDEADAILSGRGHGWAINSTIVPAFLAEMDGMDESGAIVLIATNRPEVLDSAVIRDGRVDRKIVVTRPSENVAREILRLNLKKVPLSEKLDEDQKIVYRENIIDKMIGVFYSFETRVKEGLLLRDTINGAMLAGSIQLAASIAMRRAITGSMDGVTEQDCLHAIERIRLSYVGGI